MEKKERIGRKIHTLLNHTLYRKLTLKEHQTLVKKIAEFGQEKIVENRRLTK